MLQQDALNGRKTAIDSDDDCRAMGGALLPACRRTAGSIHVSGIFNSLPSAFALAGS